MGKYMRKAKTAGDTAVMEMSQSSLGVRTRAKTLALQRLQSTAASTAAPPEDSCYLELRSRRLEKRPPPHQHNSGEEQGQEHSEDRTREECCEAALISCSVGGGGLEIEASFGENNLDTEVHRSTREITPSSSTRAAATPCSSTRKAHLKTPSQRLPLNAVFVNMPALHELEDFFATEEQSMQRHFIEKYNFDFVNDSPLSGRYEWVKHSL
ncbi:cyclin-dependent kinase inhibitor 3-like isoform X2 [Primulina huaijiensis]|uniref:cyclin-dependent kinase inhibitor 3-like isoform X2 n=1 Tax=Primulina huaijiensis TaxID=1492673 RepID=UPI003CC7672F